eukprot:4966121-Pyramimonas_sp.AAC.1
MVAHSPSVSLAMRSMMPDPSERTDSPWTTSNSMAVVLSKSLYRSHLELTCLDAHVLTLNRVAKKPVEF